MKISEFLGQVRQLLTTSGDEQFAFENPSEISAFLYGFRALSRHSGYYEDGIWTMVRSEGKSPVEMKLSPECTIVGRSALIEVANIVVDEVNDMLLCEYSPDAKLHEYVASSASGPSPRRGAFQTLEKT